MAFIDELSIHLKAGDGGNGVVRWRHEKYKEFAGPSGGNGGRGGAVIFRAIGDLGALKRYINIKSKEAERGENGRSKSMKGKDGKDLFLEVPRGSIITNQSTGEIFRLDEIGDEVRVLEGGAGGLGNEHFKSSTNTKPTESTGGESGEEAVFDIEVELIADFGLVGFPSVGKSSLLNELTNAHSKTGAYQFTTLEPFLGTMYGRVLADIPGLIEGASKGKGLGHKFLRHIKRTRFLIHCVSAENSDVVGAYNAIRSELEAFDPELTKKSEIVVLTKKDEVSKEEVDGKIKELTQIAGQVFTTSILDDGSIKNLRDNLIKLAENS